MPDRILIFDTHPSSPQVETSLAIAERHVGMGDVVHLVNISAALPYLEFYDPGLWTHAVVSAKLQALRGVLPRGVSFDTDAGVWRRRLPLPLFRSVEELKAYACDGIDYGTAMASSLISRLSDLDPDLEKCRDTLSAMHDAARMAVASLDYWVARVRPDVIYLRNCRTALTLPLYQHAVAKGLPVLVQETRGAHPRRYYVGRFPVHDRAALCQDVLAHWQASSIPMDEREAIAHEYYGSSTPGVAGAAGFTSRQRVGTLPAGWDDARRNIVFFTGSVTETAAFSGRNGPHTIFGSQFEAVDFIADVVAADPGARLYVRQHPNTTRSYPKEDLLWQRFRQDPRLTFISGDEPVDTYALVARAAQCVTYIASVGIEAAFRGKPVILTGNSFFNCLGACYVPARVEELGALLRDPSLPALPNLGAIKYAHFMMTAGHPMPRFVPTKPFRGTHDGVDLDARGPLLRAALRAAATVDRASRIPARMRRLLERQPSGAQVRWTPST